MTAPCIEIHLITHGGRRLQNLPSIRQPPPSHACMDHANVSMAKKEVNSLMSENTTILKKDRDIIAAVLSAIPGLGHIYKGHYAAGIFTMVLGIPVVLWVGILLSLATAGIGLLVPVGCWASVILSAYFAKDLRKRHPMKVL